MNTSSLVSKDLWESIELLLPQAPPRPTVGRPQAPDRAAFGDVGIDPTTNLSRPASQSGESPVRPRREIAVPVAGAMVRQSKHGPAQLWPPWRTRTPALDRNQ